MTPDEIAAIAARRSNDYFEYAVVKDDDGAYGLSRPSVHNGVLLTVEERDALVAAATPPTCATCRYWTRRANTTEGRCGMEITCRSDSARDMDHTEEDFGCTLHAPRPEEPAR